MRIVFEKILILTATGLVDSTRVFIVKSLIYSILLDLAYTFYHEGTEALTIFNFDD
jgi:hypothetical protein